MAVSSGPTKKKSGTYKGKSLKPGGGGRFQRCLDSGKTRALCASIGNARYGKKTMQKWAKKGKAKK